MSLKVREFRMLVFEKFDTESECARELGWSKQRLNKISNGVKMPDLLELEVLAKTLSVSINELAQIFLRHKSLICDNVQKVG